jgi:hypothetical protein
MTFTGYPAISEFFTGVHQPGPGFTRRAFAGIIYSGPTAEKEVSNER